MWLAGECRACRTDESSGASAGAPLLGAELCCSRNSSLEGGHGSASHWQRPCCSRSSAGDGGVGAGPGPAARRARLAWGEVGQPRSATRRGGARPRQCRKGRACSREHCRRGSGLLLGHRDCQRDAHARDSPSTARPAEPATWVSLLCFASSSTSSISLRNGMSTAAASLLLPPSSSRIPTTGWLAAMNRCRFSGGWPSSGLRAADSVRSILRCGAATEKHGQFVPHKCWSADLALCPAMSLFSLNCSYTTTMM